MWKESYHNATVARGGLGKAELVCVGFLYARLDLHTPVSYTNTNLVADRKLSLEYKDVDQGW